MVQAMDGMNSPFVLAQVLVVHRWKSAILDSFTLVHVLKKWPQMVR